MTALDPATKERQRFARSRAGQIREGMRNYIQTLSAIHTAWVEEDWKTLGYTTWQSYVDGEFGAERLQLPAEHRRKAVEELRLAGMSTRAIADTLDVDRNTVKRDLRQVGAAHPPEEVRGADGKTYRPAKSSLVEAMTGAIEDAEQRAEDHRVSPPGEAESVRGVATEPGSEGVGPRVGEPTPTPDPGVAAPAEEPGNGSASSPSSSTAAGGEEPVPSAAPQRLNPDSAVGAGPDDAADVQPTAAAAGAGTHAPAAPQSSSHVDGFSGEETGTSAATDAPDGPPAGTGDPAPSLGFSDPAGSSAVTGEPAPQTPPVSPAGVSGKEEAGRSSQETQVSASSTPNPIDQVVDAIQQLAAETGICPACQRPLGAVK